jgi:DNA-binding response OmpR family regulator
VSRGPSDADFPQLPRAGARWGITAGISGRNMMRTKTDKTPDSARLKLLLVDDSSLVAPPLMRALADAGFRVELVADPELALDDARAQRFDAVAINADLAEVNALWLCRALRVQSYPGVIMMVGPGPTDTDQLGAWRAGATDCVARAMSSEALVERILAHVTGARIKGAGLVYPVTAELPTDAGVFTMSLVPTVVMLDERPISLTRIEERLLARLWSAKGAAVAPEELIVSAWLGGKVTMPTLQVHLYQLRRKLNPIGLAIERVGVCGYRIPSLMPPKAAKNTMKSLAKT